MFKFIGILAGIMMVALAGMALLTRKERQHCLEIMQIKVESKEGAVKHYSSNRSSQ